MATPLSRRAFLALAALIAPLTRLRASGLPAQPAVSLDEFVRLSQRLTGKPALDRTVAAIYLKALQADPALARRLSRIASGTTETDLENTIIEWWYTGIYRENGEARLATYQGAVVWSSMGMPAPGTCAGPFGAWSRPPRPQA